MKFKVGDVIVFNKDLQLAVPFNDIDMIPKYYPVVIKAINFHHIQILFKNETFKFRNIEKRMEHASEAAKILFMENKNL